MFIVLKSFAGKDCSGTKGKTINIEDKKLIASLKEAGYIADFSKEQKTNASKDKEIVELKTTISNLTQQVVDLENEKQELLNQIDSLTSPDDESKQTGGSPDDNEVTDDEAGKKQNADGEKPATNKGTDEQSDTSNEK